MSSAATVLLDRLDAPRARRARTLFGTAPDRNNPLVEAALAGLEGLSHALQGDDEAAEQAWLRVHDKACVGNGGGYGIWRAWTIPLLRLAVRGGRDALCSRIEASIQTCAALADDTELSGALAHLQASRLLAEGSADAACARLAAVRRRGPLSREPALAGLDLAWLHLDAGRVEQASALMDELGPWREQHPLGCLLEARLRQALDDADGAARWHAAALAMFGGPWPAWAARWPDPRVRAPRLRALPSTLHAVLAPR